MRLGNFFEWKITETYGTDFIMKKIILIITLFSALFSTNIYAARFGSGKSFGHQRSNQHQSSPSQPQRHDQRQAQQPPHQQQATNPPTPPKRSFMSKVLPVLAGLSAGALLGSLLSGHGLGGGLGAILMMIVGAAVVFYIVRKLMTRKTEEQQTVNPFQPSAAQQPVHSQAYTQPVDTAQSAPQSMNQGYNYSDEASQRSADSYQQSPGSYAFNRSYNVDFNKDDFLRTAKITFIRMQSAYDQKNLTDIRNFTTPEVFAEIQMQLQERGNEMNYTEIVNINAALIDEPYDNNPAASVLFSGQIKEQKDTSPVQVNELWHFVKTNNNWLIAGIEQQK